METKLARIAEIGKQKPKETFTTLYHLINTQMLRQCHQELDAKKATGVDGVTKAAYTQNLDQNLVNRMKNKGYRPQPARRTYIPKLNGKEMRPLGIPSYEDKIVQMALKKIMEAIYEQDFLTHSFGARPGKSCHDALKALNKTLIEGKINWVVDADIKGFFNNVDHQWMVKFIGLRIADPNIKR